MRAAHKSIGIVAVFTQLVLMSTMAGAQSRLVAFWPFDEASGSTLLDASGNGNTAYIHTATRVAGVKGNALSFNGISDYAYANNSPYFTITNQVTLECWVNVRQLSQVAGTEQTCIRKEDAYVIGVGVGGKIGFWVYDQNNGWQGSWTLSQQSIQPSVWYHIAGVWNGQTFKVFINGNQDPASFSYNGVGPSPSNTYNVYMGVLYEGNYQWLNGSLDELKVYNYALNPDTILAHYNAAKPQPPVVLIPYAPNVTYNRKPILQWYSNSLIPVYRFEVSLNQDFLSPIISLPTADTSYTPAVNLPFGTLYWRVCNNANTSVWSSISSVTIQDSTVPMVIPFAPDPTQNRKPLLRWHPVAGATSYTIQISTVGNFSPLFLADAASDTFYQGAANLPVETIYWRVKSNLGILFSSPDTFLILNDSIPLLIPMTPDTQSNRRPLFLWHHATGATSYRIQIDTMGNFSSPYISLPLTTDTAYSPAVNLPYGKIFWRVSASAATDRYSSVDTFIITRTTAMKQVLPLSNTMSNTAVIHQNCHGLSVTVLLNRPGTVTWGIFSLAGTCIRNLGKESAAAGKQTFFWDGSNGHGKQLPSGNYLMVFTIDNRTFSKTALLLR